MLALTLATLLTLSHSATAPRIADGCPDAIVDTFGDRADRACGVAACETGQTFDNTLIGRLGEVSMFQVHPVHFRDYSRQRLIDDEWYAAQVAYEMSSGGWDWSAWSCA